MLNVRGGSKISVNELVKTIEEITELRAKVKHIEKQKGDVKDTFADITEITKLLKWIPKIEIAEGLKRQIKWMKKQSQLRFRL